jgi:phenylalanyl-tRNA synthetase beta chain
MEAFDRMESPMIGISPIPLESVKYYGVMSGEWKDNKKEIGYLGEINSQVTKNYDIKTKVYVAVIKLKYIYEDALEIKKGKALTKFPPVNRDICFLVNSDVKAKYLTDLIYDCSKNILEEVKLSDIYLGKQIPIGMKSMLYKMVFRAKDKTLTEKEVSACINKIVCEAKEKYGAVLRD